MFLTDDYFSDVNPRSMRRLMNVIYVMGRLLKVPIYVMGRLLKVPIYVMGHLLKILIYFIGRLLKVSLYVMGRLLTLPGTYLRYESSSQGTYYLSILWVIFSRYLST